jgi:hypothetical protein
MRSILTYFAWYGTVITRYGPLTPVFIAGAFLTLLGPGHYQSQLCGGIRCPSVGGLGGVLDQNTAIKISTAAVAIIYLVSLFCPSAHLGQ